MEAVEKFSEKWESVLALLPSALAKELSLLAFSDKRFLGEVSELRLRAVRPSSFTADGKNHPLSMRLSTEDLKETFHRFCRGAVYAYREQLREGFITLEGGVRVGVAGRAVVEEGVITGVSDVSSLVLRLPRWIKGAGRAAVDAFRSLGRRSGVLVWSPPGEGKTTVLRDFAVQMAEEGASVAVVDSRHEFAGVIPAFAGVDILLGYPKAEGISIATRTLVPSVIVCDEIGGYDEAAAILDAGIGGVPLVASAHAGEKEALLRSPSVRLLWEAGCFGALVRVARGVGGFVTAVEYREREEFVC